MYIKKDKVSIIVPIFNAEKYLGNCIESILKQSYKNIELILVDDGSSDNSLILCHQYAKSDKRIKILHIKNSGPSIARNAGIQIAQGNYIQFVDSDDCIDYYMTSRLIASIKYSQLAICGYKIMRNSQKNLNINISPKIEGTYDRKSFLLHFGKLYNDGLLNVIWNKLYITRIIKEDKIEFSKNLNIGEDLLFNIHYINKCNNINIIKDSLYNYIIFNNQDSLISNYKENFYDNQNFLFHNIKRFLEENYSYDDNKYYVEVNYLRNLINCLGNLFHKNNNLTFSQKKYEIRRIISDKYFDIKKFESVNSHNRIIYYLIKKKYINGLFIMFTLKSKLKKIIKK